MGPRLQRTLLARHRSWSDAVQAPSPPRCNEERHPEAEQSLARAFLNYARKMTRPDPGQVSSGPGPPCSLFLQYALPDHRMHAFDVVHRLRHMQVTGEAAHRI